MATPIRIKRSAVPGKKPQLTDLQLGELAVNFYDGKVFFKQNQGAVGVGTRIVEVGAGSTSFVGKTIFVTVNGDDINTGLDENNAKKTIKAAAAIAFPNDTIKVYPGNYVENNPVNLPDNISVEGLELRQCIVSPQNTGEDLFYVGEGTHITDISFVGAAMTNGAAVISLRPLLGTAEDRFFDGARLIKLNLDFIAREAVGYLTSTDYKTPAFEVPTGNSVDCSDDIKDIFRAICHDITRGGNSKCVGAGLSYYNGNALQHITGTDVNGYSIKEATIDTIKYAVGIANSCINNVIWNGNYQSEYTQIRDLGMQPDSVTGSNTDIGSCANVLSAVHTCAGIVTTIIDVGLTASGITTNYPGNNGAINSGILTSSLSPLQGTGVIRKGPYVRNCTNFIPNSIGARIDGFNADAGDKDELGVQGSFHVDSYTQYNQGGIGVSITNGAYCQLVSIFTICDDIAIYTSSGAQCDLTNSNSSFGTKGLVSQGIGDYETKCSDRYTGEVFTTASVSQNQVVVSGVGNNRPYQGQAIYFDRIYYTVNEIIVTNGGSGYTSQPIVTIDSPSGPGIAVPAQATATVENGVITGITLVGGGSQYTDTPNITISAPNVGVNTATAVAFIQPIYYGVESATLPSAGISTISLVQNLNNEVGVGSTVFFARQSYQIVSSHSFEYIGTGNTIETAYPSRGGVTIQENEIIKLDGGDIAYTSTDQQGNFRIGDGLIINQQTGSISGPDYVRSLFTQVTPFILALGGD
jgi:hypothetical protein